MALITFEKKEDKFGLITLNDPDSLNAMGEAMAKESRALVERISTEAKGLRAIILTGAGRAFSAGGDLAMLEAKKQIPEARNRELMMEFYHSFLGLLSLQVPLIAAINGHAIGAGLCVACACDIRIAGETAKLGFTFTKLGLHPGMGATYFVPQVVGFARAAELLLTARVVEAEEALKLGLVSKIVPTANVVEEALKVAREIASCGPEATRQLLESLRSKPTTIESALAREAACQGINYASNEFAEGLSATQAKRQPNW